MIRRAVATAVVTALVGGLTMFGLTESAQACTCVVVGEPDYFGAADIVFTGTAIGFRQEKDQHDLPWEVWSFDVADMQKGPSGGSPEIHVPPIAMCDHTFVQGRPYQVFASVLHGRLRATSCSGTRDLRYASASFPGVQTTASPASPDDGLSLTLLLGDIGMILVLIIAILLGPPLIARRRKRRSPDND